MSGGEQEQAGGVSIGHLSGGAVAAGDHAVAEDRSQRVGAAPATPEAPAAPAPVPASASGGIAIGAMSGGAVASGAGARAVDSSVHLDATARELLTSVQTLQQQLPLLARAEGDGVDVVEGELEAVGAELERTGTAGRRRLERLRDLLRGAGTVVSGLASALAVVQAIEQFLG